MQTSVDLANRLADECLPAETPLGCVAAVFRSAARWHGRSTPTNDVADSTLAGLDLRLTAHVRPPDTAAQRIADEVPPELLTPDTLGEVYQLLLGQQLRHDQGVHYTSRPLAEALVAAATSAWSPPPDVQVLDPTVGGGVFLLAAARWLLGQGVDDGDRWAIAQRLRGRDLDEGAVAVAQASLALWCLAGASPGVGAIPAAGVDDVATADLEGVAEAKAEVRATADRRHPAGHWGRGPDLDVGDAVTDALPSAHLIVGNPPFLNQLGSRTARSAEARASVRDRFGVTVGPYADTAALILLVASGSLLPNGRLSLVQPLSLLASRDAGGVRHELRPWDGDDQPGPLDQTRPHLIGLWAAGEEVFDAAVHVCAPVVSTELVSPGRGEGVLRWFGAEVVPVSGRARTVSESWAPAAADLFGIPAAPVARPASSAGALDSPSTVADLAKATAGFRDQFYGFIPFVAEQEPDRPGRFAPLITTGMIDPLHNRWGSQTFRFAKQPRLRPVVDREALAAADPTLAAWVDDRLQPKVLVATQTRVMEVVPDPGGVMIPATPVISVEPLAAEDTEVEDTEVEDMESVVWRLAAVLTAPSLTALTLSERLGTARSLDALKVAARQVLALPLPSDAAAWDRGASLAREAYRAAEAGEGKQWHAALAGLGEEMASAYGASSETLAWWLHRLPPFR